MPVVTECDRRIRARMTQPDEAPSRLQAIQASTDDPFSVHRLPGDWTSRLHPPAPEHPLKENCYLLLRYPIFKGNRIMWRAWERA